MMPPIRRSVFLASAAAIALAPRNALAQGMAKLRISGSPDDDIIGVLWGIQGGIFAKHGLDVDLQSANSGGAVSAAVIGGSLEIGKSSVFPLLAAHTRGVPLVLEAPAAIWNTDAPRSALVVAKGSPIRSGHDLNGKTVSVPALGDLYQLSISAWIDQHGGDVRTVHFLELPHRAAAESIAAGRVDAANLAEPILNEALKSGKCEILGRAQDAISKHFVSTAYFCTADFAAKNVDVLSRFRRALYEADAYANANRGEMYSIIAKYSGVDREVLASMTPQVAATSPRQLNPRVVQPLIDAAAKYKAIPFQFSAKDIIDPNATA
jgi:NitT/TauT family transport system substrate-binding protein